MPISSFSIVSLIALELNYKKPDSVLDVGAGSGFYGAVVRQYVDMGVSRKTELIGVEPFPAYKEAIGWSHYTKMYFITVQDFLVHVKDKYDSILFLDIIEHFTRLEGLTILEELKERLNLGGVLLVSTPGIFEAQGAEHGNELERHKSFYEIDDFFTRGFIILKDGRKRDAYLQNMTVAKFMRT
jgi:SAM-dependent methyltransferase